MKWLMFLNNVINVLSVQQDPRVVQLLSPPYLGNLVLSAGPAQFGYNLKENEGVSNCLYFEFSIDHVIHKKPCRVEK